MQFIKKYLFNKENIAVVFASFCTAVASFNLLSALRFAILPAIIICPFVASSTAMFIFVLGYLVPSTIVGTTSIAALPFLILFVMFANTLLSKVTKGRLSQYNVSSGAIIAFIIIAITAIIATVFSDIHLVFARDRWLAYLFFIFAIWQFNKPYDRFIFMMSLSISSVVFCFWALNHGLVSDTSNEESVRGIGESDPNYLACWIYLGLLVPKAWLLFLYAKKSKWAYVLSIPTGLLLILAFRALSYGASRGMGLAYIITILCLFIYALIRTRPIFLVVSLIALAAMGCFIWESQAFDFFRHRIETGGSGDRIELVQLALNCWLNEPFILKLFGTGLGSTYYLLGMHTHNLYTEFLIDCGLIGLLAFLALFGYVFYACSKHNGAFRLISMGWLIFLFLAGFSLSPFYHIWPWLIFAVILPTPKERFSPMQRKIGYQARNAIAGK